MPWARVGALAYRGAMAVPPSYPPADAPVDEPDGEEPYDADGAYDEDPRETPHAHVLAGVLLTLAGGAGVWGVWQVFVLNKTGRLLDLASLDGAEFGRNQLWDTAEQILDVISVPFIAVVLLGAVLLAALRRRVAVAVQVAVLMGGANLTTQVLKNFVLDRPDVNTYDSLLPSLPSGHTTAAASVAAAAVLVVPRALRPYAALVGALYTTATGVSTLVAGWHRPSDVVAAVLVVVAWIGIASVVGALITPPDRWYGVGRSDSGATTTVASLLLVVTLVAGLGSGLALLRTLPRVPLGEDGSSSALLTAYVGGALGIVAVTCTCFALLLLVRRATEPHPAR